MIYNMRMPSTREVYSREKRGAMAEIIMELEQCIYSRFVNTWGTNLSLIEQRWCRRAQIKRATLGLEPLLIQTKRHGVESLSLGREPQHMVLSGKC